MVVRFRMVQLSFVGVNELRIEADDVSFVKRRDMTNVNVREENRYSLPQK